MSPRMIVKKSKGKSKPMRITREHQKRIKNSKIRLKEMLEDPEISEQYKKAIEEILKLEDYDLNFILGFYELTDGSSSMLAKYFDVSTNVVCTRIKKIIKKIKCCI